MFSAKYSIVSRARYGIVIFLLLAQPAFAALQVVYPRIDERSESGYGYQVLALALAKSGVAHELKLTSLKMNQQRARIGLENGDVSVLDFGTSPEYEQRHLAVYFPIDLGMGGYRLLLVRADHTPQWNAVRDLGALQRKVAGQGPGWSDAKILQADGIEVVTAEFANLFRMLNEGRFDFFPLGAEEASYLLEQNRALAPNCTVLDGLALHYAFARFFFVRHNNTALRDALQHGLEVAFADGSLIKLLRSNVSFQAAFSELEDGSRTVLELPNPFLTDAFHKIPAKYFYTPRRRPTASKP